MQHPAVPELAHTRTRPVHWVATAAALSCVIAMSSFLQPDPATAAPSQTRSTHAGAPAPAAAPDPADAEYPLDCGPSKPVVQKKTAGDLDGDHRPESVAVVHCDAGSGTPPRGVYVITAPSAQDQKPRVVATLLDPKDGQSVSDLTLRHGAVTATLLGYSSRSVPRCCPDLVEQAKWQWNDGAFVRSDPAQARGI